jgi:hypothetical protein
LPLQNYVAASSLARSGRHRVVFVTCSFRITDATCTDHFGVFAVPWTLRGPRITHMQNFGPSKRPVYFKFARSHRRSMYRNDASRFSRSACDCKSIVRNKKNHSVLTITDVATEGFRLDACNQVRGRNLPVAPDGPRCHAWVTDHRSAT